MRDKRDERIKIGSMILFVTISVASIYYFHLVAGTTMMFTHFLYIPIILSCIWWKRRGIAVAVFLAGNLLFSHVFYQWQTLHAHDVLRSFMFVIVAILVVEIRERNDQAEEEVQLAYEKINQIFRTTGNGLRVIDTDFNMMHYNESLLTLLRITKEEIAGKKCYEVFPGPLCHTPGCPVRRILEGEEHVECEIEKKCNDGTRIFCIITANPLRGAKGTVIGIVEDIKDISDRRRAEEALRESEKRYRTFAKNFKGILYQTDIHFTPIFFHGAVEAITGYKEEDFVSKGPMWDRIIHREDFPVIDRESRKLLTVPHYSREREYKIVRRDGEIRWVEEIIQNTCDKSGKPVVIQGVIYDITERKRAESALKDSEERFLHAQKMDAIGRLAGGVAHDFNNLLTVITGNSDLLLNEMSPDNACRGDIEEIYRAGERATGLTRQLLAFSRRQLLSPKMLDLAAVVADAEKMLKRIIGEDIELVTLPSSGPHRVKADPGQILQIIVNLSVNACDAMPHGGKLIIRMKNMVFEEEQCIMVPEARPGRFVCLSFEDTGIGMDKTTLSHIFEPFFTTKGPGEGTGLGLSTVYGIVKQHEGFITVYSEPGQGTTFKVYLPVPSVDLETAPEEHGSLDALHGQGERILLVEDEEGVRRFARKALSKNGYSVFEAGCAQEAMDIFDREKGNFLLVLSDVVLPDQNGIQLVDRLLSKNRHLMVILSSGYSDQRSQWPLICERNFKFIKKPYTALNLLQAVKEVREQPPSSSHEDRVLLQD
ncbi:MAG: PAS domain S-box protein [bacterium]